MKDRQLYYVAGFAAVVPLVVSAAATAGEFSQGDTYTNVSDPWPNEASHNAIINEIYGDMGGDFTGSGETTGTTHQIYENDQLRLERVSDTSADPQDMNNPDVNNGDQIWHNDSPMTVSARARFASFTGNFGFMSGTTGTDNFQSLFSIQEGDYGYDLDASATLTIDGEFRWAYDVEETGQLVSSSQADNPDEEDFMVTYRVTNLDGSNPDFNNGLPVYLVFWEDFPGFDYDYNDLVIELAVIPLPAPLAMGLLGLAGVAAVRRRRGKQQ